MTADEAKLADEMGRFTQVVADGRKVADVEWRRGRILCSTERLVLVSNDSKRVLPLETLTDLVAHEDPPAATGVEAYVRLSTDSGVFLVAPEDVSAVEGAIYEARLDGTAALVKHPAVEGGVVTGVDWERAKLTVEDEALSFGTEGGRFVTVELDDVGSLETGSQRIRGAPRQTAAVDHVEGDRVVQTRFSGPSHRLAVLAAFLRRGARRNETNADVDDAEAAVLMALYSGVSPFEVPDFVGMDADRVEDIFADLVDAGLLTTVRTRRQVSLQPRGRVIAGDEAQEQ